MVKKDYTQKQIIGKLREAEIHIHQGMPIAEVRRKNMAIVPGGVRLSQTDLNQ